MMVKYLSLILCCIICTSHQQNSQLFESSIRLTPFGTAFEPRNSIESLAAFLRVQSLTRCAMQCNQERQCRTFDYDQSSRVCRLFEGDISTGTVLNSSVPLSSRIGSIRTNNIDALQQYSSYNQSCYQCGMGNNRYLECNNYSCLCPQHTYWNGQICSNQLYNGSQCNSSTACRQDLNLTCSIQARTCVDQRRRGTVSLL